MSLKSELFKPFLTAKSYLSLIKTFRGGSESIFPSINLAYFLELLSKKKVSVVQIGANDGKLNDPIYPFIKSGNWKGVLVEPLPPLFEKLQQNYKGIEGLVFENVGIANEEGSMDFFYMPDNMNEPDWLQQIGTFDRNAIELNLEPLPELKQFIAKTSVRTIRLSQLFQRNNIKNLDLLLVDAEGFEYKIIKQVSEIDNKPKYIIFEWGCMEKEEYDLLLAQLVNWGYEMYTSGGDILATYKSK